MASDLVESRGEKLFFSASHDGFKNQGLDCIHQRDFLMADHSITLVDHLQGEFEKATAYFILHPSVAVTFSSAQQAVLTVNGLAINFAIDGGRFEEEAVSYHPNFGVSLPTTRLAVNLNGNTLQSLITW